MVFELIASNYCYPTYVGEASGCYVVNDFVTFQVAAICGLIGMTLGWRGVMTKYSGFYDLPTALGIKSFGESYLEERTRL